MSSWVDGLIVGGFKGFKETQEIPIRPLTILVGPNSGGKSTVLHVDGTPRLVDSGA